MYRSMYGNLFTVQADVVLRGQPQERQDRLPLPAPVEIV